MVTYPLPSNQESEAKRFSPKLVLLQSENTQQQLGIREPWDFIFSALYEFNRVDAIADQSDQRS